MSDLTLAAACELTCSRQDAFTESFLTQQKEFVFSDVGVLIYVFDIESREVERDLSTYSMIIKALEQYSPKTSVFCLVHKMDLVQNEFREGLFRERERAIRAQSASFTESITAFATTIWDQSLYKAWGNIVHSLIPNHDVIKRYLEGLAASIDAEEVVLFEAITFLAVVQVTSTAGARNPSTDRLERLSNIVKNFKYSLS
jgi:Ras-related GTP-binding protein A/B